MPATSSTAGFIWSSESRYGTSVTPDQEDRPAIQHRDRQTGDDLNGHERAGDDLDCERAPRRGLESSVSRPCDKRDERDPAGRTGPSLPARTIERVDGSRATLSGKREREQVTDEHDRDREPPDHAAPVTSSVVARRGRGGLTTPADVADDEGRRTARSARRPRAGRRRVHQSCTRGSLIVATRIPPPRLPADPSPAWRRNALTENVFLKGQRRDGHAWKTSSREKRRERLVLELRVRLSRRSGPRLPPASLYPCGGRRCRQHPRPQERAVRRTASVPLSISSGWRRRRGDRSAGARVRTAGGENSRAAPTARQPSDPGRA